MATAIGNLMANIRPRIILNQATHIQRTLSGKGVISVTKGVEVAPQDIIGHSNQSSGYSSVQLAKQLGESPSGALKYLQVPFNSMIFKGELLALKKGLLSDKKIEAPTNGVLEKYDLSNGQLRLKFLVKPSPLTAGVFGIVDQVDKQKGEILIRTMATVINGVIGFGFQRGGTVKMLGDSKGPIRASQITPSYSHHILVGGALIYEDALKKAATLGVLGIITGGINMADFRSMVGNLELNNRLENDVGMTILATEGFGPLAVGDDILKFLQTYVGKFIFLDGNKQRIILPNFSPESLINLRKVNLPAQKEGVDLSEGNLGELEIGRRVRFISAPMMGIQGKITAVDNTPTLLESGISTYMVTVETAHKKIKVPFPNIELIS